MLTPPRHESYVNAFSSVKHFSHSLISPSFLTPSINFSGELRKFRANTSHSLKLRRKKTVAANIMLPDNPVISDICATVITAAIARGVLGIWELTAKYDVFDSKLNRKLVHISIGLVFMLCWPLFSSGYRGAFLACLVPGLNALRVLLIGLGIYKDEATVKSMSRFGDYRELLKGPFYYASAISFACLVFWRTSPIGIAAICNLCAGDGLADIVGRRLGKDKLPYNKNKSYAGSIAMATAGFVASVGYMHYLSAFGFMQENWGLVFRLLVVSLVSSVVESLPISTQLDDNLTVPLASFSTGFLLF
ncbi:farnesol kinase, chloroplastic isoform X2 [Spinacia oleracea]|uniref:Farnesol kinase, chloroplastic isoform X2 n=1 Tax=Spinacia oleracea TaxID=3562 RepID=A0A9R0JE27_SPIOL|nr:farnesol kinase, chloroplastic-like isoform X2 [Spinacia oleracea]